MIKFKYFLFFAVIMAIVSCGGKKFQEPGKVKVKKWSKEIGFQTNFTPVWKAAKKVLQRYRIIKENKQDGIIETDWATTSSDGKPLRSDTLFSGYGKTRIPYKIRYKVLAKVIPKTDRVTLVKLKIKEQYLSDVITKGDDFTGSIYKWYDTKSSTQKEHKILMTIEEELKKSFKF